jgi:hypothetical protein
MIAIRPVFMARMGIKPVCIDRCDEGGERKERDHQLFHDVSPLGVVKENGQNIRFYLRWVGHQRRSNSHTIKTITTTVAISSIQEMLLLCSSAGLHCVAPAIGGCCGEGVMGRGRLADSTLGCCRPAESDKALPAFIVPKCEC